ncbi:MAG TPA: phage tail protein [Acetobacteraceae bacterium]|jgi:microcystin-dependent protein
MSIVIGSIATMGFDSSSPPSAGWLFCDGSAVSRTTYADLFSAIGTSWGSGDGTTTFNLPDLRGYFVRGVSGGTARDPGAAARHSAKVGGNAGDAVGTIQDFATALPVTGNLTTNTTGSHVHGVPHLPTDSSWYQIAGSHYAQWNSGSTQTSADGDHSHACGANNGSGGDSETRSVNVYVDYVIWAGNSSQQRAAGVPQGSFPIGSVMTFSGAINDSVLQSAGWIYCDGRALLRANNADLFAAIGTAYGAGDGVSSFNIPDLRGYFQRGVSGDTSNDPNAASRTALQAGGNTGNNVGSFQQSATGAPTTTMTTSTAGTHQHSAPNIPTDNSSYAIAGSYQAIWNSGEANTGSGGDHQHSVTGGGDAETRPVNAQCNFVIKFAQVN